VLLPLFAELKRRRVFRALVGYGIAAFAVLQIIEPVMHGLLARRGFVLRRGGARGGLPCGCLVKLHGDPRFAALLRKMNLPQD
jgi:hypothetical protein